MLFQSAGIITESGSVFRTCVANTTLLRTEIFMERFSEFKKNIRQQVPLAMHTWFQLGGIAELFAEPKIEEELAAILKRCRELQVPTRTLGYGSNIIVSDAGVRGMVFRLTASCFTDIRVEGNTVVAGGGAKLGRVVTTAVHAGLAGLENLIGIPGTVGGAIAVNLCTSSENLHRWVKTLRLMNPSGKVLECTNQDVSFGGNDLDLQEMILLEAVLELNEEDPAELSKRMQRNWIMRKTMFPTGQCSGYIFKNPRGGAASELIERAGLKGTRIGGAVVNERNPNFIVAEPECTSTDVLRLIDLIRNQVLDRTDTELELYIQVW
ncbi:MAG: UDP-N-acetylmuramate dehydrogenase [Planctomycetaceae bacterium]|jgi:UDP-N-acetylmuramate dehydrogenase|nr:UDP-N-acetylmuramate dehydrogenase [Planctomycetaceae bacterium]